jgi:hypothetical protein
LCKGRCDEGFLFEKRKEKKKERDEGNGIAAFLGFISG